MIITSNKPLYYKNDQCTLQAPKPNKTYADIIERYVQVSPFDTCSYCHITAANKLTITRSKYPGEYSGIYLGTPLSDEITKTILAKRLMDQYK